MKLSHEITALYLSSFKDQGLLTRILTLPANVVRDAASMSIVSVLVLFMMCLLS